jgi:hypothetical protein
VGSKHTRLRIDLCGHGRRSHHAFGDLSQAEQVNPTQHMKNRNYNKTIIYKGGTIELMHTAPEFRSQCKIHKSIFCWFNASGYAKQRVFIGNLPSIQPAITLNYIRNRIKNAVK